MVASFGNMFNDANFGKEWWQTPDAAQPRAHRRVLCAYATAGKGRADRGSFAQCHFTRAEAPDSAQSPQPPCHASEAQLAGRERCRRRAASAFDQTDPTDRAFSTAQPFLVETRGISAFSAFEFAPPQNLT